jgi:hypothetical protein
MKECIVLLCCSAVVATFCRAATRVCLHDVSLMYLCVESAYGVEGGEQDNTRGTRDALTP